MMLTTFKVYIQALSGDRDACSPRVGLGISRPGSSVDLPSLVNHHHLGPGGTTFTKPKSVKREVLS